MLVNDKVVNRISLGTIENGMKAAGTRYVRPRIVAISDPDQVVLESDPYRRLAYTWHTLTPEWAARVGLSESDFADIAAEKRSQVSFEIESVDEVSKLTVVHEFFDPESKVVKMVSGGWPRVLSELKTLLETGDELTSGHGLPA